MIKHIVAWDFPESDRKAEQVREIKTLLEELPGLISEIRSYEVGVNIKDAGNTRDMILLSAFDDQEALKRYAVHPEHQRVLKVLRETVTNILAVDFETV